MEKKEIDPEIERFVKSHAEYQVEYENFVSNDQQALSKIARLDLVFKLCGDMAPAEDGIYAKLQLDTALNVVEDTFSKIIFSPMGTVNDGRMYPAQEDYRRRTPYENIATYEHRAHLSNFGCNGSINIVSRKGSVLFDKAGADQITVGELRELQSPKLSSNNS